MSISVLVLGLGGLWMILAARRQNRRVWGETVCPAGGCRYRNLPHAQFCARCGRPLRPG